MTENESKSVQRRKALMQPKPAPTREAFNHHVKMLSLAKSLTPAEIEQAKRRAKAYADAKEAEIADYKRVMSFGEFLAGRSAADLCNDLSGQLRAANAEVEALTEALREMEIRALEAEDAVIMDEANEFLRADSMTRKEYENLLAESRLIHDRLAQLRADAGEGGA